MLIFFDLHFFLLNSNASYFMIGTLQCVAPSIELVACPWVRFFPHPRSCCCRRIYAFLSVSAARAAPPRRQHSGRGGCNRRRPPASKTPRRGRPGAAHGWAPRYGTSSWWKPHYLESRSLRLLNPLHRTTHPCHRARRACATPHATPHQRRPRPPSSSTRQRGMVEPLPSYSSLENAH